MAISKADFQAAYVSRIADYPALAQLYRAQDPRVIANLDAMASMMAMLSAQIDAAEFEPFLKTRDGTILADATLKGILPIARPATATISVKNNGTASFTLPLGRRLVDSSGRIFLVDATTVVRPGLTVEIAATQKTLRTVSVTVAPGGPYYRIPVPASDAGGSLSSLTVESGGVIFDYAPDWFNVAPNQKAYQVETDELRNLYVVLGQQDVVGYQPGTGEVFILTIEECDGAITDLAIGSSIAFEYATTAAEGQISMTVAAITDGGQDAPSIDTLRQMARYPAIYDHDAVYLGNFDFLLRRYLSPVVFLSVWNEQIEERARGSSLNNINTLFVSGIVDNLTDANFASRVADLIRRADDSYKVRVIRANEVEVPVTITATVSVVHDPAEVASQIRALILGQYGRGQPAVSSGGANPINQKAVAKLLTDNIDALKDQISDFQLTVRPPGLQKPEDYLYVSDSSLSVIITAQPYNTGLWNY